MESFDSIPFRINKSMMIEIGPAINAEIMNILVDESRIASIGNVSRFASVAVDVPNRLCLSTFHFSLVLFLSDKRL